jgi:hypothetical protein
MFGGSKRNLEEPLNKKEEEDNAAGPVAGGKKEEDAEEGPPQGIVRRICGLCCRGFKASCRGLKACCVKMCTEPYRSRLLKYGLPGIVIVFLLVWAVQLCLYEWATFGCGPKADSSVQWASFGQRSDSGDQKFNMAPLRYVFMKNDPPDNKLRVKKFATEQGDLIGDMIGQWTKYWGPLYNTYVLKENFKFASIAYMRRNLFRFQTSYRIGRCDNGLPMITISEGGNWFGNWWRHTSLSKLITGMPPTTQYDVYLGDSADIFEKNVNKVAVVQYRQSGSVSITNATGLGESFGSASPEGPNEDSWTIHNEQVNDLPYYVIGAMTLLRAYDYDATTSPPTPAPSSSGSDMLVQDQANIASSNFRKV